MPKLVGPVQAHDATVVVLMDEDGNFLGTSAHPLVASSDTPVLDQETLLVQGATLDAAAIAGQQAPATENPARTQRVAQSLPAAAELVRLGGSYHAAIPTASAFNLLTTWPTTRAELVLYNGEPATGRYYYIDAAWVSTVVSPAASAALTLIGQVVPSGAAPTDNTGVLITSRNGRPNYGGRALKALANTSYGVANKWRTLASNPGGAGNAQIGVTALATKLGAAWIVPPGGLLLLNAISGTAATAGGLIGVAWHEVTQLVD